MARVRGEVPTWQELWLCLAGVLLLLPALSTLSALGLQDSAWMAPWSAGIDLPRVDLLGAELWGLALGFSVFAGVRALWPQFPRLFVFPVLLFALLAWLTLVYGLSTEAAGAVWLAQLAGVLLGLGIAAFRLAKVPPNRPVNREIVKGLWGGSLAMAMLMVLFPGAGGGEGVSPTLVAGLTGYPAEVAQRIYQLIKATLPGLPVGFLLALGLPYLQARMGIVCFVLGYLGWNLLVSQEVPFQSALEVVFVVPGLAFGLWLGVRRGMPVKAPVTPQPAAGGADCQWRYRSQRRCAAAPRWHHPGRRRRIGWRPR